MYLSLHQVPQRRPAMTPQSMRQPVGFRQVVKEFFLLFLFLIFGLQTPGNIARTQWSGVQLRRSMRLNWSCSDHSGRLGEPAGSRFSLVLARFRVASHSFIVAERSAWRVLWRISLGTSSKQSIVGARSLLDKNACQNAKFLQLSSAPLLDWAREELSVEPKRGFGLMFLSAVEFTHCLGSRDLL